MKTLVIKSIILLLILATCIIEPVFSQNQEQLFQQALMKEEGEGALQEAIDIYSKIVENSTAERSLQAKAQLQIGLCYEKLGKKKATEAYNKVIAQFADQQQTAEIAKTRLQNLNSQITLVDKNATKPTFKQIVLDRKLNLFVQDRRSSFEFSHDGENLVFMSDNEDSSKGPVLYVANIAGPPSKRLVTPSEFERETFPRYLPDGKHIVFRGYGKGQGWSEADFYFVSATGGKHGQYTPKTITFSPNDKYIIQDNKLIAKSFLNDSTNWFSSLSSDFQRPVNLKVSPNSKWISYNTSIKNEGNQDCFLVSASGDKYIRLTDSKGFDGFGTWSEKNNFFYFVSDRSGDRNIFRLKINPDTGEKTGKAEQITFYKDADVVNPCYIEKKNALAYCLIKKHHQIVIPENVKFDSFKTIATGTVPVLSPDGNTVYFVGIGNDNQGIYSIPRTGGVKNRLTDLNPDVETLESGQFLSPDGSAIAFFTEIGYSKRQLCFLSISDGKLLKSVTVQSQKSILTAWAPDSKKVAFVANNILYTIPAWENKAEILIDKKIGNWESFILRWSPDGKYIAGLVFMDGEGIDNSVVIVSVKTGEIKRLTTKEQWNYKQSIEWYPDSKKLAYMYYDPNKDEDGIWEAYIDGSPATEMINQPDVWDYVGAWDYKGENYYFLGDKTATEAWQVYRYNLNTKKIIKLSDIPFESIPGISKDGKHLVFTRVETENQLWMMEGVE